MKIEVDEVDLSEVHRGSMERYADHVKLDIKSRTMEETDIGSDSICSKCVNGQVYRRRSKLHVSVFCQQSGTAVPSDIVECSRFADRKTLSIYEMQQIYLPIDKREGINDGSYA